jgi:hypothetical protein
MTPSSNQINDDQFRRAREKFVELLEARKRAYAGTASGLDGPNKLLARKMQVSPARVSDFLQERFFLKVGERRIYREVRLRKVAMGFATSVERALEWLRSEQVIGDDLETRSIVGGYWPPKFLLLFSSLSVQQAIRDGVGDAQTKIERLKTIDVELRISKWGPFAKSEQELDASFFAHYGQAIFRGIDPLHTTIRISPWEFASKFDLPLRGTDGNWAVSMGPYETLDRRFRGLDCVPFPAIRYPLIGLVLSQNAFKDEDKTKIDFDFLVSRDCSIPRFVADEAAEVAIYALFNSQKQAHAANVLTLDTHDPIKIAEQLWAKLKEGETTIALLTDGILAFEVFGHLPVDDVHVLVLDEKKPFTSFAFSAGIMFRQEDHSLVQLLHESQQQLFRSRHRVVNLLAIFLKEVDDWVDRLLFATKQQISKWPPDAAIFLYPHHEVADYIRTCFATDQIRNADDIVKDIFVQTIGRVKTDQLRTENREFKQHELLKRLFKSSTEYKEA